MHAHLDSAKFESLVLQRGEKVRRTLTQDRRDGTGLDGKLQDGAFAIRNADPLRERARHTAADYRDHLLFAAPSRLPRRQRGVRVEDSGKQ